MAGEEHDEQLRLLNSEKYASVDLFNSSSTFQAVKVFNIINAIVTLRTLVVIFYIVYSLLTLKYLIFVH
jgi:hypothetical protein